MSDIKRGEVSENIKAYMMDKMAWNIWPDPLLHFTDFAIALAAKTADERTDKLKQELKDADYRAGLAERLLGYRDDTIRANEGWRNKNKALLGYSENVPFDIVWDDVIKALGGYDKAQAALDEINKS